MNAGFPPSAILAATGLAVGVIHPKRVRDFARASGILAKTDKIDARGLARFGECIQPPIRPLPDEVQWELAELLDRRMQLVLMRAGERAADDGLAGGPAEPPGAHHLAGRAHCPLRGRS